MRGGDDISPAAGAPLDVMHNTIQLPFTHKTRSFD